MHRATADGFFKKSGPKTKGNTLEVSEMDNTLKVMSILVFEMATSPVPVVVCVCDPSIHVTIEPSCQL